MFYVKRDFELLMKSHKLNILLKFENVGFKKIKILYIVIFMVF